MSTAFAIDLIDEINGLLDSVSVLQAIEFHADKVQVSGDTIKAFCPVHKDSRFRSLLLDSDRHAFRCTIKTCQGYMGGSLIELYALSKNIPLLKAACTLVDELNVSLDDSWRDQLVESYLSEAGEAREQGSYVQAEVLLSELVAAFPEIPDAKILLANVHEEMGNPQAAAEEYTRIIESFIASERLDDAEALANDVVERFPENEDLRFIRVKISEELGSDQLAVERIQEIIAMREAAGRHMDNIGILEKLVDKAPGEPAFLIKLGELHEQQHNLRAASRQFEKAAQLYFNAGDGTRGIELLEKVVQFNSENIKARLQLADHLASNGDLDGAREHTFRAINQQIDQQTFGDAVTTVDSWLEREPDNIDARELLARIFLDQDRAVEATKHLLDGAEIAARNKDHTRSTDLLLRAKFLTPDATALRHRLIEEFQAMGEQQRAAFEIIDLVEILFSDEKAAEAARLVADGIAQDISVPLKLQLVSSLASHGMLEAAMEDIAVLQKSIEATGTPTECAELYELLVRIDPADQRNHERLFQCLWELSPDRGADSAADSALWLIEHKQPVGAATMLELATGRLETYVPAASRLFDLSVRCDRTDLAGTIYQVSIQGLADQDPEAALKAARHMVEIDPAHPSASSDIAFLLASLGYTNEAADQYARVANLLLHGGDYENGYQFAQEAVALNPQSISALAALAMLGREVLSPDELAPLAENLLSATRQATDREEVATGYFTSAELDPDNDDLLNEAAQSLERLKYPEAVAQVYARQATKLSMVGNWEAACAKLKQANVAAPELAQIGEQLGEACRITGDSNEAVIAYAEAAVAYVHQGDQENAVRCTNSAQLAGPESVEAWEALFRAASASGETLMSQLAAEKLSRLFAQSGPAPTTARWTREWVRLAPDDANAHEALGVALLGVDQAENAAQALSTAAALFLQLGNDDRAIGALQVSVGRNISTARDRDSLLHILQNQASNSDLHNLAGGLLGQTMLQTGDLDQARNLASELQRDTIASELWADIANAESDSSRATDAWLHAAESLRSQQDITGAISALERAVSLGSPTFQVHELLAELLATTKQYDKAVPHQLHVLRALAETDSPELAPLLAQMRTVHGENTDALISIAKALLTAKRPDLAVTDLEAAAILANSNNNAAALITVCGLDETLTRESGILTRARADALMGLENEQQALEWVSESGRNLLAAGKAGEARQMAERWISLAPADLEAQQVYASACEGSGMQDEALQAYLRIAQVLLENEKLADALASIQKVLSQQPESERALRMKSDVQKRLEHNEDASETLAQLGSILVSRGDAESGRAAYRESLLLHPQNTMALWEQAELVREADGAAMAMPLYRQWANARREFVSAEQWIEDLESLIPYAPESTGLLRDLSDALLRAGRQPDAQPYLEKLALLLENEGDYEGAASAQETIIAHAAVVEPGLHLKIAQLYEKSGLMAQAQNFLRKAAAGFSESGDVSKAADVFDNLLKLAGESSLPEDYSSAAKSHAEAGNTESATRLISKALVELDQHSGSPARKESILAQALAIAPLNVDYVSRHMALLPAGRAMTEGLSVSREMQLSGHAEDAIQILTQVIALAPHDMSVRQEIFEPLRQTGNLNRLRSELLTLASDALAAGDYDAAYGALDEAAEMTSTAQQHRALAELNERAHRQEEAAQEFTSAAVMFADAGKSELAIASINRAISAKPLAISADAMAALVKKLGPDVHNIAREQLRAALTARHQKQSQTLAMALLETSSGQRSTDILKVVFTLGGSTFLVGIVRMRVDQMLDQKDLDGALEVAEVAISIAPDAPDAWFIASQIYHRVGKVKDARRSAMEAARLFHTAGAVIEEETCYVQALTSDPDNVNVKSDFAEYLARELRPDEAIGLLQEIIHAAEQANNSDLLLETLNRAVQVAPANADLRGKLAALLEPIAPDSAIDNWVQTAEIFRENNQYERARRTYQHVLSLSPHNEKALTGLLLDAREAANMETAAKFTLALAKMHTVRHKLDEACRLLQTHLEMDPDNMPVLEKLADLSVSSKDSDVFITTTRSLARRYHKAGDNKSALHHYELLLERTPNDVALLTTLIDCTAAAGMSDRGIEYARRLLAVAHETEDPERIRLAATTILHYDNQDAEAHNDLGESLLSLNRVPEAVTEWLRAAELYEGSGMAAKAFTCYRRVTQLSPSKFQAWQRLGVISLTMGDLETARMCIYYLLDKSSAAEKKRTSALLADLIKAVPDEEEIHEKALTFFRKHKDNNSATQQSLWLSNYALEAGRTEQAEAHIAAAMKLAPDDKELKNVHYDLIRRLGRLEELQLRLRQEADEHLTGGDTEQAIVVLKQLADLTPGHLANHRDLASMLIDQKRYDEALEHDLEIVRLLLNRSELEEARENAELLISKYPQQLNCRERIADLLAETSYPDLAARYYRAAADIAIGKKDYDRAIAMLRQAVKVHPHWADAHQMLAETCKKAKRPDEAFNAWLDLLPLLLETGEYAEAAATLDKLSKLKPDSSEVREQMVNLYERTGKQEDYTVALQSLAELYDQQNDAEKALASYRKLAAAVPEDSAVLTRYIELLSQCDPASEDLSKEYTRLADVLTRQGDYEGAFHTYEQVLGLTPDDTTARSRYATFLLTRGNRNRAMAEMRKLAALYMQRQEPAAAVDVLNAALTISPRDADICLALATAQEEAGMHEDARVSYARASAILASTAAVKGIDTYRRILTQDDQNTAVRSRLVELLIKSGDKMEAAREARILAEIHINRGEMDEAKHAYSIVDECEPESIEEIQHAIQRDSYDPSLQYVHYVRLGSSLFACGDIDNALDAFRTARSLHDDSPELIQKCIECVSLIAPEFEAVPDYLLMAEKLLLAENMYEARQAYEKVRRIDPFNNDARCGLESINAAERQQVSAGTANDDVVLKSSRAVNKRVALTDLLLACQDAAKDQPSDSQKLGGG